MDEMVSIDKKRANKYGQDGAYEDYEIESAARTIREAEEIKMDEKKMPYVKKCMEKDCKSMENAITSIAGLRERRLKLQEDE